MLTPARLMATLKPTAAKPAPPKPAPPGCNVPWGVTARQVVLVDAQGSDATIPACKRSGSQFVVAVGPYAGHVGRDGVSSAKREGDPRLPLASSRCAMASASTATPASGPGHG